MTAEEDAVDAGEAPHQPATPAAGLFGWRRHVPQVATGLGLAVALLALLFALNFLQLTAPGPAHRVLRRAVASLTEIDSLLAAHGPALRQEADASPDEPLSLPDYPLDVPLSPQEASRPPAEVRDLLLDRSADQVYNEGPAAFRDEDQSSDAPLLSLRRAVRSGLSLLTADRHDTLRATTLVLTIVSGALAGTLLLMNRGYGRLTALGATVAVASLVFLLLVGTARLALGIASLASDDYITVQLLDLTKEAAWLPFRNGIALAGLGLALLALGLIGERLSLPYPSPNNHRSLESK